MECILYHGFKDMTPRGGLMAQKRLGPPALEEGLGLGKANTVLLHKGAPAPTFTSLPKQ